MKRIFVLLTDRVPSALVDDLVTSDLVLVGPNLDFKHPKANIKTIGLPSTEALKQLAKEVANSVTLIKEPYGDLLGAVSNEVFSYVLRPLVSVVETLLIEADKFPEAKLVIVHVSRTCPNVPLTGFVTTESPRGSKSLLGAYIANQVKGITGIEERIEFISVKGDILCNEYYRSFIIKILNWAVRLKFAFVLIVMGLLRPKLRSTGKLKPDAILIVRAFHQARFAKRLCDVKKDGHIEVLILPQFIQGGLIHALRTLIPLVGEQRVTLPTFEEVIKANWIARQDRQHLISGTNPALEIKLDIAGQQLQFNVKGLALELSKLSILLFYRRLLALFLKRRLIGRLINFELVGRIAGMDRLAADEAKCKVSTIQTAVVSETPHPIFPHSHVFFADGPQSSVRLAQIGTIKRGLVKYGGSPVPILPFQITDQPKVLVFFTQPYEQEITIEIIKSLVEYSHIRECRLLVKPHPRDDEKYQDVLGHDHNIATMVAKDINPEVLILQSDICITRTSSIARESLAMGRPVILCLWSDFDKGVSADYIEHTGDFNHCVYDKNQLYKLLDAKHELAGAATNLRSRLFGESHIVDLAQQVFRT